MFDHSSTLSKKLGQKIGGQRTTFQNNYYKIVQLWDNFCPDWTRFGQLLYKVDIFWTYFEHFYSITDIFGQRKQMFDLYFSLSTVKKIRTENYKSKNNILTAIMT